MLQGMLLLQPLKNAGGTSSFKGTSKFVDDVDVANPPVTVVPQKGSSFPVKGCALEMRKEIAACGGEMAPHSSMEQEGPANRRT